MTALTLPKSPKWIAIPIPEPIFVRSIALRTLMTACSTFVFPMRLTVALVMSSIAATSRRPPTEELRPRFCAWLEERV